MRLPNDEQRLVIVGRNGTGKTQAAVWHLSLRDWKTKPWVIFNWKQDALINAIPNAQPWDLNKIPEEPGIYIVAPLPDQQEEVDSFLWTIWQSGNIGLYIDEGYMLANGRQYSPAYRAIQTQGRSKRIPTITLSQRPVAMDRFVFSETNFYQIFPLNDKNDRKRITEWAPEYNPQQKLPPYFSWYYDVDKDDMMILKPVPDVKTIIQTFQPPETEETVSVLPPARSILYV